MGSRKRKEISLVLYSKPKCPACRLLKKYLDDRNLHYIEISYDELKNDKEKRMEYQNLNTKTFPTLWDRNEGWIISGFNKKKLEQLL